MHSAGQCRSACSLPEPAQSKAWQRSPIVLPARRTCAATLEAHGNAEAGDGTVPRGLHDVTGRPCRGDSTPLSARRVLASSCLSQSRFSCLEPDHLLSVA